MQRKNAFFHLFPIFFFWSPRHGPPNFLYEFEAGAEGWGGSDDAGYYGSKLLSCQTPLNKAVHEYFTNSEGTGNVCLLFSTFNIIYAHDAAPNNPSLKVGNNSVCNKQHRLATASFVFTPAVLCKHVSTTGPCFNDVRSGKAHD